METKKATSKDHLVPGSLWTIGPNKRRMDYSWTGEVWEVIRVSGPTAWLRHRGPRHRNYGNVVDVQVAEHDWFTAEGLLEDLARHEAEAELEWVTRSAERKSEVAFSGVESGVRISPHAINQTKPST